MFYEKLLLSDDQRDFIFPLKYPQKKRCVLSIKWQAITKEDKNTSHLLYFNRIFKNAIDLFGNHSLDVVVGDVKTF